MYKKSKNILRKFAMLFACMVMMVSIIMVTTSCGGATDTEDYDLNAILTETADLLIAENDDPDFGSVGGEWMVLGMAKWGGDVPEGWYESYYKNVEEYVASCNGNLSEYKNTEYSRVIIALTAIGKDPTDVAGFDLTAPLADYDQTIFQGINGPVYALLALDSGDYDAPQAKDDLVQATRTMYVDYILDQEVKGGGWCLAGGPADPDITAIVLQALAKYQEQEDVEAATERALDMLSEAQSQSGGFENNGIESSETVSQVILALTELDIAIDDGRFVKDGNTLVDKLMEFRAADGGFKHIAEGESDILATEQAFYALVSLYRVENGETSLYK